jgi:DNA-binding FadR family transcriptional regulator
MTGSPSNNTDPIIRLRRFIEEGGFERGVRLPPERQLTTQLGMTRATLRKALEVLERDGVIWRHVGKGTFIADGSPQPPAGSISELTRQITPFRMMRARMAIEPAIAREAAINASGDTQRRLQLAQERAKAASNWHDYEIQDDLFHRAIAEASDNALLVALFDQLNDVRRAVAWGNVTRQSAQPSPDHSSFAEHDAIAAAITNRDPGAAYEAMRAHLRSVSQRLFGEN